MKSGTLLWFPGNSAYAVSDGVGRVIVLDGGVEITMRVYDRDVKRWITCAVER